jgi:hypothetical protein
MSAKEMWLTSYKQSKLMKTYDFIGFRDIKIDIWHKKYFKSLVICSPLMHDNALQGNRIFNHHRRYIR